MLVRPNSLMGSTMLTSRFAPGATLALDFTKNQHLVPWTRTNLLLRSQEFDNASWALIEATIEANTAIAPDGTLTADKIIETTATNVHQVRSALITKDASAITYTLSAYFKAGERTLAELSIQDGSSNGAYTRVNLSTGTVTLAPSNFGPSPFTNSSVIVMALGNGWYRIALTSTTNTATTVRGVLSPSTGSSSYLGDGASGVYIWGAQIEIGSVASPYIPTTTTAVTSTTLTRGGAFNSTIFPNLTVSRSSVGYAERLDGTLQLFQANEARITDKGLLVEESRTNKNTNTNVNPTNTAGLTKTGDAAAVLSVVDDSAELAAIGLTGNVYKLDNSLGVATAEAYFAGTTGNTNAHVMSVYARMPQGAGANRLLASGGSGASSAFPQGGGYRRYSQSFTPTGTGIVFAVQAQAGAVIYFILNQLEEGSFVTSPIPVSGASATRGADSVSVGGLSGGSTLTMLTSAEFRALNAAGNAYEASLNDGTVNNMFLNNFQAIAVGGGGVVGGVSLNGPVVNGAPASGAVYSIASRMAANDLKAAVNGTLSSTPINTFAVPSFTRLDLGNRPDGARTLNGYLRRVVIYPYAMNDAQLQAATL